MAQRGLNPGPVDDRQPGPGLVPDRLGKRAADRGYIAKKLGPQLSALFDLQLIAKRRSNMKNQLRPVSDKLLLHSSPPAVPCGRNES